MHGKASRTSPYSEEKKLDQIKLKNNVSTGEYAFTMYMERLKNPKLSIVEEQENVGTIEPQAA